MGSQAWRYLKALYRSGLGTQLKGGLGSAGLTVDSMMLEVFFQSKSLYDSMRLFYCQTSLLSSKLQASAHLGNKFYNNISIPSLFHA